MEFEDVVRRRRMVRRYAATPVDPAMVDRAIRNATRAPNAGFSQGWGFLVLDTPEDVARYWETTAGPEQLAAPDRWLAGLTTAPVVVLPCSSEAAYQRRYAEADKQRRAPAPGTPRWTKPYWDLDTAMASLLILLTATDEGLGSCFFGLPPDRVEAVREAFGIPADHDPIGAITLGHRLPEDTGNAGSPARRARRPLEEVLHRGRWHGA